MQKVSDLISSSILPREKECRSLVSKVAVVAIGVFSTLQLSYFLGPEVGVSAAIIAVTCFAWPDLSPRIGQIVNFEKNLPEKLKITLKSAGSFALFPSFLDPKDHVEAEEMPSSIMTGFTRSQKPFVAIKLEEIERSVEPFVLILEAVDAIKCRWRSCREVQHLFLGSFYDIKEERNTDAHERFLSRDEYMELERLISWNNHSFYRLAGQKKKS